MLPYCLRHRKNTESKEPRVGKSDKGNQYFYRNVRCVVVKNPGLSKKILVDDLEA